MLNSPKILYLDNFSGAGLGGGERHLIAMAEGALQAGYDVIVGCASGSGLEKVLRSMGVGIRHVNFKAGFIGALLDVRGLCGRERPDILHTTGFLTNNVGRLAGRMAGVPIIISTVHCEPDSTLQFKDGVIWRIGQKLRNVLDRFTARFAGKVVAVSELIRKKLTAMGLPSDKVVTVPNAVSPELIARLAKNDSGICLPPTRLIGCSGRIEAVKGFNYFIEACAILAKNNVDFHAVIMGDGPVAGELEAEVNKLGIADKITFTGWLKSLGEVFELMSRLDVYVLPSLSEGLNTTLLEALVLERPVVATDVGGNPEIIIDRQTGLLVPPRDPRAIADAVSLLLDDPLLGEQLAAAGKKMVMEHYTLDQMIGRTLGIYEELLQGG